MTLLQKIRDLYQKIPTSVKLGFVGASIVYTTFKGIEFIDENPSIQHAHSQINEYELLVEDKRPTLRGLYSDKSVSELVNMVETAEDARDYCIYYLESESDNNNYGVVDYMASLKQIHEKQLDDCDGGSVAALELLRDDYHMNLLIMYFEGGGGHMVAVYKDKDLYGTIGINEVDYNEARFEDYDGILDYFEDIHKDIRDVYVVSSSVLDDEKLLESEEDLSTLIKGKAVDYESFLRTKAFFENQEG